MVFENKCGVVHGKVEWSFLWKDFSSLDNHDFLVDRDSNLVVETLAG